ncbi:hypothetical protein L289_1474 [Acinetobacter gerneri DSM 14967 = CIP 107464 = MTCC 9824]|nr:hypothetical protein [Acinetobacter gerneri]EPR84353.1 hypothetical protein L289_1474 [Acinetobacter gerneri DSM 14967 = CIP 107464 = MTCC 9824]
MGLQSTGNETEQLTKATMGQGTVTNATDGTNRDINQNQEITRDQVTGMLDGSVTVDHRLLTESGRAEIIQEQKNLPQNGKIIAGSTATGGLILGSGIVGLFDENGTVKDATTLTQNNVNAAYNSDLAANLQLIQEGKSTNVVDNQDILNKYSQGLIDETSVGNTQINLVQDLLNKDDYRVNATTNITNKLDTYLDVNAQNKSVNLITHEASHQAGFSENSADALAWLGETAFNINSWVNSTNINDTKHNIQNIPKPIISGVNDSQAQQDLLAKNASQIAVQQAVGDDFKDRQPTRQRDEKIDDVFHKNVATHSAVIFKDDKVSNGSIIANDLKIAGKCSTDTQCKQIALGLTKSDGKTYFIVSNKDKDQGVNGLRLQAETLMAQLGGDFKALAGSNKDLQLQIRDLLVKGQNQPAVDISDLYNIAEGLAYVRMYKDAGVIPSSSIGSAIKDAFNYSKAAKLDNAVNSNTTAYPQDFAIDDLKVPGRQIDTALNIGSTVMTVADLAYIGKYGLTAFNTMKATKVAQNAEKAAARIENNVYRDGETSADWTSAKKVSNNINLAGHWQKHKDEFPTLLSQNDYYRFAQDFVNNPPTGTLVKVRKNGDSVLYQPSTNTFAVKTKDGLPRTIFKPNPKEHGYSSNLEYFNAQ